MSGLGLNVPPTTCHKEMGPRFKISSERPEKRGIYLVIPGWVVYRVIHYTTATPRKKRTILWQMCSNDFPLVGWLDDSLAGEREREC